VSRPRTLGLLVCLASLFIAALAHAGEPPSRPAEAPIMVGPTNVPPLPPEYLTEDRAGIRFAYHPSARDRVRVLIAEADEVRAQLSEQLGRVVLAEVDVRVARGSSDFERIVPAGGGIGSPVIAYSQLGLLVMSLRASPSTSGDVRAAFRRGMAHLALDEVAGTQTLPRWFRLGFALNYAGPSSLARGRSLWWASMQQRMIPVVDLDWHLQGAAGPDSVAAAEAADFVRFLVEQDRGRTLPRLLETAREANSFDEALATSFQSDAPSLERAWRQDVAKHKAFVPVLVVGTGLWIALGLIVQLRRRRRLRDAETVKAKSVKVVTTQPKRKPRSRKPTTEIPEPVVPKVSHNGRWHTLH
jgi:hypothetical protein